MSANQEVTVASKDDLDVREFSVHQSMSSLFTATVTAVSKNPDIDFEAVIGQEASLALHGRGTSEGKPRTWKGICNEFHQVAAQADGLSTYHMTIVPKLWLATQKKNHRIFQMTTELDIATKIFGEWGVQMEKKISSQYKKRKYRVQYGETDFAFASRMLEEAGITFYFEDKDGETVCVLSDAPHTNDARVPPIAYHDEPSVADKEHVTGVRVSRQIRPGKVTMRDYDYRRPPTYPLASTAADGVSAESQLEHFDYVPGSFLFESQKGEDTPAADDKGKHRTDEDEGAKLTQKRLLAARNDATSAVFHCNVVDLAPGSVMSMLDHPARALGDGKKLLVVESRIDGRRDEEQNHYVEVRSADNAYHPPLKTQKPRANGVESATIVGPGGEEIHTDEFGRVRVQFHWDRVGTMDDNSSCWMHVNQPWGGAGYGGSSLPRIGQEVIVDFLDGDPDRPVVTGRVYTNTQKTPYKLPANKTQSGWKSNTSPTNGGYNEMMFEDKAGQELLHMRAQKDMSTLVNNNQTSNVGNNRTDSIVGNDQESVNGSQAHSVDGNKQTQVGQNDMSSIMQSLLSQVGGDRMQQTTGGSSSQAATHQITSQQSTTLQVGSSTIFIGPDSIIIQASKVLLNPGADVAASASLGSSS